MLDNLFLKKFDLELVKNFKDFKNESLKLIDNIKNDNILKPFLYSNFSLDYPLMFDEGYAKKIIDDTFLNTKSIVTENLFAIRLQGLINFNKNRGSKFYEEYTKIQELSITEYWDIKKNQDSYLKFNDFECFLELELDEIEAEKYLKNNSSQVFNYEGWFNYYHNLLSYFYNEFIFDKKLSDKKIRFKKKISDNLFIGIEYDFNNLKYGFKKGDLSLPNVELIIFDNNFQKKMKYNNFDYNNIWSIGKLQHPFFYMYDNLNQYYGRSILLLKNNGQIEWQNLAKKEKLISGNILIYNSKDFGENLKKFSFYEFHLSSLFHKKFINYIENSLINISNEKI